MWIRNAAEERDASAPAFPIHLQLEFADWSDASVIHARVKLYIEPFIEPIDIARHDRAMQGADR